MKSNTKRALFPTWITLGTQAVTACIFYKSPLWARPNGAFGLFYTIAFLGAALCWVNAAYAAFGAMSPKGPEERVGLYFSLVAILVLFLFGIGMVFEAKKSSGTRAVDTIIVAGVLALFIRSFGSTWVYHRVSATESERRRVQRILTVPQFCILGCLVIAFLLHSDA